MAQFAAIKSIRRTEQKQKLFFREALKRAIGTKLQPPGQAQARVRGSRRGSAEKKNFPRRRQSH
jgi:hypothetical protein